MQSARPLWEWRLDHEEDPEALREAESCEAAYLQHPSVGQFAATFGSGHGSDYDALRQRARELVAHGDAVALDAYLDGALRFTATHAETWHRERVRFLAAELGRTGGSQACVQQLIVRGLRADVTSDARVLGLAAAGGWIDGLRRAGDFSALGEALSRLDECVSDDATARALTDELYGRTLGVGLHAADLAFVMRRWESARTPAEEGVFNILGRFLAVDTESVAASAAALVIELAPAHRDQAIAGLWNGYYETLIPRERDDVDVDVVDALLELTMYLARLRDAVGNDGYHVEEVLRRVPRNPLPWILGAVRRRIAIFGDPMANPQDAWSHPILPAAGSPILEAVTHLDAPPTPVEREVFTEILRLRSEDPTIEHHAAGFLAHLDPHGHVLPDLVCDALAVDGLDLEAVVEWAEFGREYPENSQAWRRIGSRACRRVGEICGTDEARRRVYAALMPNGIRSFSGVPGVLHMRFQSAIDQFREALEREDEESLVPYWEERLRHAERRLEIAKGRIDEGED